jgi:hypothetical protein
MRSRVAQTHCRRRLRPPLALVPSVPHHVLKCTTSTKDLFLRFPQTKVPRSRFSSEELRNCSYRPNHPDAPTSNPNAIRLRMEFLPRHLPVIMGEGRRNRRCEPSFSTATPQHTTNPDRSLFLRTSRLRPPPRKHPPSHHRYPRSHPHRTLPFPLSQKHSRHPANNRLQRQTGAASAVTNPPGSLQRCVTPLPYPFFRILDHNGTQTTPQRQLPFSASTSGSGTSATGAGSASDPRGLAQSYSLAFTNFLASPSSPSPSSSSAPHDRSFGSLPPSPSPTSPLAAYRGRRAPIGRASFLYCSNFFSNSDLIHGLLLLM